MDIWEEYQLVEEADYYYFRALETYNLDERRKLLEKAIEIYPKHLDAEIALLFKVDIYNLTTLELFERANKLLEDNKVHPDDINLVTWGQTEYRPYMRLVSWVADMYKNHKMYSKAIELLEPLYANEVNNEGSDGMGIRYKLMNLYVLSFRYNDALKLYESLDYIDEQLAGSILIAAVLEEDYERAAGFLDNAASANPYFISIFRDEKWPNDAIQLAESLIGSHYTAWSIQAVVSQLDSIYSLIRDDTYVFEWIKDQILKNPKHKKTLESFPDNHYSQFPEVREELQNYSQTLIELINSKLELKKENYPNVEGEHLFAIDLLKRLGLASRLYSHDLVELGLNSNQLEGLYRIGVKTLDDFSKKTKAEILDIKGIGPKTVESLEEQGVKFKN